MNPHPRRTAARGTGLKRRIAPTRKRIEANPHTLHGHHAEAFNCTASQAIRATVADARHRMIRKAVAAA